MDSQPGPSRERSPVVTRRKTLTDEQLLALLQESDVDDGDSDFEVDTEKSDSEDNLLTEADIPEIRHSISAEHWSSNPVQVPLISFIGNAGLKVQPKGHEPIDYFDLLVSDDFYNFIVEETNLYAVEVLSLSSDKSRITHWKDLTTAELKVFLGLLYHTGTIRLNKLEDYWKQDDLFNIPCFKKHMSRNRFLLILRVLHFSHDAVDPNDRLFKIKSIVEYFNNKMDEVYYPGKNLSIDESMILWRGRLIFRQYIQGKRHKFGIKLYMLAEPNGLNLKTMIYTGQKLSQLEQPHSNSHTENVVINLMEGKLFKGHSLYMDNYYNSVNLAQTLISKNTYCTSTLRSNRKKNPSDIVKKKFKKGENIPKYSYNGICVFKWKDKRDVLGISTEWTADMVDTQNKRGDKKKKPLPIIKYNDYMSGVDRQDQLLSYYPCERKTLRWYKKVGIHILQQLLLNSYLLYCQNERKIPFYNFRLNIIRSLLKKMIKLVNLEKNNMKF